MRGGHGGQRSGRGIFGEGGADGLCLNAVRETPAVPKTRSRARSKMGRGVGRTLSRSRGDKGVSGEAE